MVNFLDTSAILNNALNLFENIYISPLVVTELESIKNSNIKSDTVKYLAREAVRDIISSKNITYFPISQRKINKLLKKYDFLSDINDHRLLCEALILAEESPVQFITSDGSLYLFAKQFSQLQTIYIEPRNEYYIKEEDYCGWSKNYPSETEMISLYTHPEINTLHAKTNEFVEIYEGKELKDILFWNGQKYTNLKYQNFKGFMDEKIAPKNLEQKMLFHLLQNDDIKIKLCTAVYGAGKTYILLQHALHGIKNGRFSRIVFVRNNVITKGSREIGFLGGNLVEKIYPYLMPIADLTSKEYLHELIETELLEPVPLGFLRGRDFSNSTLIFVDEAENLTAENIQLLIGRVGEGSQLWIAGDLKQIDHKEFEKNNGIRKMIHCLAGQELFGMVKLMKSERSKTSELANLMDD